MPRSTARFIPYDLRPAKQAERRILLDFLASLKEGGLGVSDSCYVGMGGFKFYDFILMHRHVGLREMISLEHDKKMAERAQFNRPYDFIRVENKSASTFLEERAEINKTIFWLDYDDSLNDTIIEDIYTAGNKLANGSMIFVTVAADLPRDLRDQNERARQASLRDQFGDLALAVTLDDVEDSSFPDATYKILVAAFRNAFAARSPLEFAPDFRVLYRDTVNMITVGGYLVHDREHKRISRRLRKSLPFLYKSSDKPFRIRNFNLSERERALIEFASSRKRSSKEANQLKRLGITANEIDAYRDLLRFMPRYFEALF